MLKKKNKCFREKKTNLTTSNELHFELFSFKAIVSNTFVKTLPSTDETAKLHLLKIYTLVQLWLGNSTDVSQCGWQKTRWVLLTHSHNRSASIRQCSEGCGNKCSCRKAANPLAFITTNQNIYSTLCFIDNVIIYEILISGNCRGSSCTNKEEIEDIDDGNPFQLLLKNIL